MSTTAPLQDGDVLSLISSKRAQLDRYLAAAAPKKRTLVNVTIFGGTLAAALTAGPAIGGQPFTAWITKTLGLKSPAWQLLCGASAACSVAATLATQVLKSQNIEERVSRAQSCRAKLEVLEIGLTAGHFERSYVTNEYLRCVEECSALDL